jgi:hypothetical protein
VSGAWAWTWTWAGVDAQDAELDGEKEAVCTEPDGTQVPAEEAEECAHHLVHPVYSRWPQHLNVPALWVWHGYMRTV